MSFSSPIENLSHLHFPASGTVIDVGVGSGHYAFLLAERLRENRGKVIAVDVQKDLLAKLKSEMVRRGVENIESFWGDVEEMRGSGLADNIGDAAVVSNILFQLTERDVFAQELFRVLKKGGEVLVIDWSARKTLTPSVEEPTKEAGAHSVSVSAVGIDLGPEQSYRISETDAEKLFERHGFTTTDRFNAGDHHWGRVFKKS